MRIEVIEADGWKIQVRGRTRRTKALESEYLINLKQAHSETRDLAITAGKSADAIAQEAPHGWSVAGVATDFRSLAARIHSVQSPESTVVLEPFAPDQLVALFNNYLDCEQLPDHSDLWSKVEDAIQRMDKPPASADPLPASDTPGR